MIVEGVLENHPIPLQIQLETRDGKTLEETTSGAELSAETRKLLHMLSIEIANLKRELEEAIVAKDEALKELDAERTKIQKEMTKWEEQRKELTDGLASAKQDAKKVQEEVERRWSETPPWGIWVRSGGIKDFMRTLYQNILDRNPESPEALEWHARHTSAEGLASTVGVFFTSPEYVAKGLSTEATVDKYYLTLMGRQPETRGKVHWVREIQRGMTLLKVANSFVSSDEYRRRVNTQMAPDPIHWPA